MKKFLFALTLFFSGALYAQEGYLSLKHYSVPLPEQDYIFNDLTVDSQNRLLLAHRTGILQFDGRSWQEVTTESTPHNFIESDASIYILTREGISVLSENAYFINSAQQIYKNKSDGVGKDLLSFNGKFYYLIDNEILRLNTSDFSSDTTFQSELGYEEIFMFKERLFAFDGNFLLELVDDTWIDLNMYAAQDSRFIFSCQTDDKVFLAYDNGDFFSFDGDALTKYSPDLNSYLRENYPVSGKLINDKLIIATLTGGAVIVDTNSGKIDYSIQYLNGLPADEVMAITVDNQGGIWLAHEAGLSRALPDLPLHEYQHYPGLEGIPQTVANYKDTIFIGTSEGLFFLDLVKDYQVLQKELIKKVKVEDKANADGLEKNNGFFDNLFENDNETKLNDKLENFVKDRLAYYKDYFRSQGFRFKSLKEKLEVKEQFLRDSIASANNRQKDSEPSYRYKTVKSVVNVSKLKSIKHKFKLYNDLDVKVHQLLNTSEGLIAICADGIYLCNNNRVQKLVSQLFLQKAFYNQSNHMLWLYGAEGLFSYQLGTSDAIIVKHIDNSINDLCLLDDELVITNSNYINHYQVTNEREIRLIKQFKLNNPFSENIMVFSEGGEFRIIKSDGIYSLNSSQSELKQLRSFTPREIVYLKDSRSQLWLSIDKSWEILAHGNNTNTLQWLKILPVLDGVYYQDDEHIFMISQSRVFKLDVTKEFQYEESAGFISGAYQNTSELLISRKKIKIKHDNNSLRIQLSSPEYLYPEGVKYQYFISGLMDEWSDWSTTSEIDFPFIPSGDYSLEIKTKSGLYENINELDFEFKVLPPYWKTWWFYLLEIAFFSLFILVSLRLNRSNHNSYITNAITFMTLILFIEFLATVLENNLEGYVDDSPVYGFLLNVTLALSITPLERGMNQLLLIMKTKNVKGIVSKMRKNHKNSITNGKS